MTKGKGYLRNILLSTDLIRNSFKEAKTLKEGMERSLFDEINQDVEGFWSFNLVNDPYLNGNIKVVDTKTMLSPKQLLDVERPKGNPDSTLCVRFLG